MKKLIVILALILGCALASHADVYKYKTSSIALRSVNSYGNWTDWSDWEDCSVLVVINTDKDLITIYSAERQEFDVYDGGNGFVRDAGGGQTWTLRCVDVDGVRCEVRIRIQSDGQYQLYIDYSNLSYVYNIEPR